MLKVKLSRIGKKNQPLYRIVVKEGKSKRDGQVTASIGHYRPAENPPVFNLNHQSYLKWLSLGAQPTATVRKLVAKFIK